MYPEDIKFMNELQDDLSKEQARVEEAAKLDKWIKEKIAKLQFFKDDEETMDDDSNEDMLGEYLDSCRVEYNQTK
jgi:hypothetical protein